MPSPRYCATAPSNRPTSSAAQPWKAAMTVCRSSGSSRSDSAVEPTRSQNMTVSCRRSGAASPPASSTAVGAAAAACCRATPQSPQKRASRALSPPQAEQPPAPLGRPRGEEQPGEQQQLEIGQQYREQQDDREDRVVALACQVRESAEDRVLRIEEAGLGDGDGRQAKALGQPGGGEQEQQQDDGRLAAMSSGEGTGS